jgi:hypothetical protein
MPATRDKTQKITFIYKNFHNIYRKGLEAAKQSPGLTTAQVLKVEDLSSPTFAAFTPPELIAKRLETAQTAAAVRFRTDSASAPEVPTPVSARAPLALATLAAAAAPASTANPAIESLKQNLKDLNDLHARLKFMLQELEELSSEE